MISSTLLMTSLQALARAIYSRKSILILDDISSAQDKMTSSAIYDKLFGQRGLVRGTGATVIIATHACKRRPLQSIPPICGH